MNCAGMPAIQPTTIQPKRILVITLRYLGDTLLVTPLLSSLKRAYPAAKIDVLLPQANLGMLEGNPDVESLIPLAGKPGLYRYFRLLCGLFQRYDLAISTQAGDRPILCAIVAGSYSLGFVPEKKSKLNWKRRLLNGSLIFAADYSHAVLENLRFCQHLQIKPFYSVTPPQSSQPDQRCQALGKYVVMHIQPQWRYKQWHEQGWLQIADFLNSVGYRVVLTGSPAQSEQDRLKQLQEKMAINTVNLAGSLSLANLAALIKDAALFVGPDTGITHLAAATGVPTVAIFGPTDPRKWAPWPVYYADQAAPFSAVGIQRISNVWLVQGKSALGCVPCQQEGCERNRQSASACLEELSAQTVIDVLKQIIEEKKA